MRPINIYRILTVSLFLLLFSFGCISTPRVEEMAVGRLDFETNFAGSVSVDKRPDVSITRNKHGFGENIAQDDFLEAVRASFVDSNIFSGVTQNRASDYQLYVTLYEVHFRLSDFTGLGFAYTVKARWELIDTKTSKVIFDESVSTPGHATVHEERNGITRNTIARERAAQANIREGIRQLSLVDL